MVFKDRVQEKGRGKSMGVHHTKHRELKEEYVYWTVRFLSLFFPPGYRTAVVKPMPPYSGRK
jgi:hypothetical protein